MKLQWYRENIDAYSGYSDEARNFLRGLKEAGCEICLIDRESIKEQWESIPIKNNNPQVPIVYHTYRHKDYALDPNQYSIVRTMFEASRIPQNWVYQFNQMDEVWVPNQFNAAVFANSGVDQNKIHIIPSPFNFVNDVSGELLKISLSQKFKFLSVFNYEVRWRKGVDILLQAYIETFSSNDDVCLVLKTKTSLEELKKEYGLPENIPEIQVIPQGLTRNELLSLYKNSQCFVLPTRGEGVGRPFLDAIETGIPVIGTGWGGNMDFMDAENAYIVDYTLKDIRSTVFFKFPGFYGAKWAEPDKESLKSLMMEVFENQEAAREKTLKAKSTIEKYKARNVVNKVLERLNRIEKKSSRKIFTKNIFERLSPLLYPNVECIEVSEISKNDYEKVVESVLIYGTGAKARIVHDYLSNFVESEKIFFTDQKPSKSFNGKFKKIDEISNDCEKIDMVVIGASIDYLPEIYNRIVPNFKTTPIYIFE